MSPEIIEGVIINKTTETKYFGKGRKSTVYYTSVKSAQEIHRFRTSKEDQNKLILGNSIVAEVSVLFKRFSRIKANKTGLKLIVDRITLEESIALFVGYLISISTFLRWKKWRSTIWNSTIQFLFLFKFIILCLYIQYFLNL
jgi:hypothetical protein